MKKIIFVALYFQHLLMWSQIALPIQQSTITKNQMVINYDITNPSSYTRGATTVTNITGTGVGSLIGAPIFMNSLGFLSFNGINQYLVTPNIRPYFKTLNSNVQKSMTLSFWFYPTQLTGVVISELNSQTPAQNWHASNIEMVNGVLRFRFWPSSTPLSTATLTLNRWYHVTLVYDGTSIIAYLNGVQQGSLTYDREIPYPGQNFAIAAPETTNIGSGGGYGGFHLAQFKIHQIALTASDILQEYLSRKNEFDYTLHSPSTNSNPTYWNKSTVYNGDAFSTNHYTPWLNSGLGWAAGALDLNQWITLNYDVPAFISGVVFQGRANNESQWVTKAHIETSLTGSAPWTRVLSNVSLMTNATNDVRINFPTPIFTKFVKVIPTEYYGYYTLRMGLLVKPNVFSSNQLVLHYNPEISDSYSGSGTSITDLSGNAMNGTLSNVSFSNSTFTFNGSNSQVSIPDNATLEPGTDSWTIEVWMKNSGSIGTVIGKYNNGGRSTDISYALRLSGSNLIRADFSNGSALLSSDNYTFTANTWVQIVYVLDRTNNNLYTYSNGELKQTKAISITGSILNSGSNLYIGSYNGGEYSQYYDGQMGIVRMYRKALTAAEIAANFSANRENYGL